GDENVDTKILVLDVEDSKNRRPLQDEVRKIPARKSVLSWNYSTASFSMMTFKCVVTSLCSRIGTVNSPSVLSGSWSWILRRSRSKLFLASASAISPDVTDPKS